MHILENFTFPLKFLNAFYEFLIITGQTNELMKKKFWNNLSNEKLFQSSKDIDKDVNFNSKKISAKFLNEKDKANSNFNQIMNQHQSLKSGFNHKPTMYENQFIGKRSYPLSHSKHSSSNNSGSNISQKYLIESKPQIQNNNNYYSAWSSKLELDNVSLKSKNIYKRKRFSEKIIHLKKKHLKYLYRKNFYFDFIDPFEKQKKIAKNPVFFNFPNVNESNHDKKDGPIKSHYPINFSEVFKKYKKANLKNLHKQNNSAFFCDNSKGDLIISIYNKKTKKYITFASAQDSQVINEYIKKKNHKKKDNDNNRIQKNIANNIAKNKNLTKSKPTLPIKISDMDKNISEEFTIESDKKNESRVGDSHLMISNNKKFSFKHKSPQAVESDQRLKFPKIDKSECCGLKRRSKTENLSNENLPNTIEDIKVHANKNIQSIDHLCVNPNSIESYNVFKNNLSTSKNSIKLSSLQSNYLFFIHNFIFLKFLLFYFF